MSAPEKTNDLAVFQNQINQSILNESITTDAFVIVKLDKEEWLIDMQSLMETGVPSRIAKNAAAPPWVLGIANFKGQVWTILDTQKLLYDKSLSNPRWAWVTLLRPHSGTSAPKNGSFWHEDHKNYRIGLLWTEVVEIATKERYDIQPEAFENAEEMEKMEMSETSISISKPKWCRAHYKDSNGKIWKELDVEELLSERGVVSLWKKHAEGLDVA